MKCIEKTITLEERDQPLKIIPISDIHIGASGVNKKYLQKTINWIKKEPNCYAVGLGDYCDCIDIKDKRFDIKAVDKEFVPHLDDIGNAQVKYAVKLLKPIEDKILCMITGNHEDKLRTRYSVNVMNIFEDSLDVTIGDYMTYMRVKFDRKQFNTQPVTFWLQHGWFSGRKMGGKINQIMDVASSYEADVYIVGHSHDLFVSTSEKLSLPSNSLTPKKTKKIFINSGTFLETTSLGGTSYSEQKAYSVAKIGNARLNLYPQHGKIADMHVSI